MKKKPPSRVHLVLAVKPTPIAPQDRSGSIEILKAKFSSYPEERLKNLFLGINDRLKQGSIDIYDTVILASALLTNMSAKDLSDIYCRGRAKFTGAFARQHIHETVIKRNILSILADFPTPEKHGKLD